VKAEPNDDDRDQRNTKRANVWGRWEVCTSHNSKRGERALQWTPSRAAGGLEWKERVVLAWEGAAVDGQSIPHLRRPRSVEAAALIQIHGSSTSLRAVRRVVRRVLPSQAEAVPTVPDLPSFLTRICEQKSNNQLAISGENAVQGTQSTPSQSCWRRGIFHPSSFFCNTQSSKLKAQAKYLPLLKWQSRGLHSIAHWSRPALPLTPIVAPRRHRHTDRGC
jgi:hypothetical protein